MFEKLKSIGNMLKTELKVYRLVMKDSRTPFSAKVLLGTAIEEHRIAIKKYKQT